MSSPSLPTINLITCDDWDLQEAVALYINGWKRLDPICRCCEEHQWEDEEGRHRTVANIYSLDAIITMLGTDYDIRLRNNLAYTVTIYEPSRESYCTAGTLERAIIGARLRMTGKVDVRDVS